MSEAFVINLRSIARRELKMGHGELGHILDAAADEIERLRGGIQNYLSGDYGPKIIRKIDKCPHGQFGYEACEGCIDKHFSELLGAKQPIQDGK